MNFLDFTPLAPYARALKIGLYTLLIGGVLALYGHDRYLAHQNQELTKQLGSAVALTKVWTDKFTQEAADHRRDVADAKRVMLALQTKSDKDVANNLATQAQMDTVVKERDEYRRKYEDARLERLSSERPGLLTLLAAKSAKRRNQEWMDAAQGK